ncbi:MAG: ATP-binding cassette domain-containing protein [Armatimonadetes bacterium]|nr:ATP-binding cassette domain-containing protein [Armatimonadota bacterium]
MDRLSYSIEGKLVLDEVSFELYPGEIFGVMGLSGAGKSTLLHNIMRLVQPQSGRIIVHGVDITTAPEAELNEVRLRMGMAFQYSALFDSMTVYGNVAFGLRRRNVPEPEVREKVTHFLDVVDMSGTEDLMPADLSGGMRKRVSIARALATEPEVVLYDEPTSGLDPVLAAAIDHLIARLRDDYGVSAIIVTHDVTHLFAYANRAMMLYEGKAIACGTPAALQQSEHPVLRQFITGSVHGPIKV